MAPPFWCGDTRQRRVVKRLLKTESSRAPGGSPAPWVSAPRCRSQAAGGATACCGRCRPSPEQTEAIKFFNLINFRTKWSSNI